MQTFARYGLALDRLFDDSSDIRLGDPVAARFSDWGLVWTAPEQATASSLRDGLPLYTAASGAARLVLIPFLAARQGGTPVPGDLVRIRILSGAACGRELQHGCHGAPDALFAAAFDSARAGDFLWRLDVGAATIDGLTFCIRPANDARACVINYKGALELSRNPAELSSVTFLPA